MFGKALYIVLKFAARMRGINLDELFADGRLWDSIVELVKEKFFGGLEIGDGTLLRDLIRQAWENREEILAFVIEILKLFGVLADTVPTMMAAAEKAGAESEFKSLCNIQ